MFGVGTFEACGVLPPTRNDNRNDDENDGDNDEKNEGGEQRKNCIENTTTDICAVVLMNMGANRNLAKLFSAAIAENTALNRTAEI